MSDCKEWDKYIGNAGYGLRYYKGKTWGAHRAAWDESYGTIPEGMNVLHRCDNKACVEPVHLFLGTQMDNLQDARDKGRRPKAEHGSISMYYGGCRCDGCKLAGKSYRDSRKQVESQKTQ